MRDDKLIWVEKYRPKTIEECILPNSIKNQFKGFIESGDFPNLLFTGTAGTGKTTSALALCNELNYETVVVNASDERNIDLVRNKIKTFASQSSLEGKRKAIILDEADGLNKQSAQPALRAAIEEYKRVKFILTANYKNKLIDPIHSRTSVIAFNVQHKEKETLSVKFLKRCFEILEQENIEYDKSVVGAVVKQYFPDNRRILNELQRYSKGNNKIDKGLLSVMDACDVSDLLSACKNKKINDIRQWVVNNIDIDAEVLFREVYDQFYTEVAPSSLPELIILIAKYMDQISTVADQEINVMAFLMEVIGLIEFK
jgi:DNA polymerase III delta prime subunit